MSTVHQQIWSRKDTGNGVPEASYKEGPEIDPKTKTLLRYYKGNISRIKNRHSHLYPTTSSNRRFRDARYQAARRSVPIQNDIAAFKQVWQPSNQLWVTTYPYFPVNRTRLFGAQEDLVFHVHVPSADAEPAEEGWFPSITSFFSRTSADSPHVSPWRTPLIRRQFAQAPIHDGLAIDDTDAQATRFVNDGPILRPASDILYLDKTFWQQYFERLDQNVDILVPGVFPDDLAQIKKVAVDITVLRNKDEFAAVARAIGRNLPNVDTFWAMVTSIAQRPDGVQTEQLGHLQDGLDPDVTDEQKVRLGIHNDVDYSPPRGVVTANLSRLNILAAPGEMTVKYMLLTYFDDDDTGALHSNSSSFDLELAIQSPSGNGSGFEAEGISIEGGFKSQDSKARRDVASQPNNTRDDTQDAANAEGIPDHRQSLLTSSARITSEEARNIKRKYTQAQVHQLLVDQGPIRDLFTADTPQGFDDIPAPSREGSEYSAWWAISASFNAAIPRLARSIACSDDDLIGWMNIEALQDVAANYRAVFGTVEFSVDFAAEVFHNLVTAHVERDIQLGYFGPLLPVTWGGNENERGHVALGVPTLPGRKQIDPKTFTVVWIWYNNNFLDEDFGGIRAK